MAEIFVACCAVAPKDRLVVGGRHLKPVTDELLVSVHPGVSQVRSVVLSRGEVRDLHAALGRWLAQGWPGVAKDEVA